jgi:hypothetical protein
MTMLWGKEDWGRYGIEQVGKFSPAQATKDDDRFKAGISDCAQSLDIHWLSISFF